MIKRLLAIAFSVALVPTTVQAKSFNIGTILRIIDGREVFIDQKVAIVNDTAKRGQELRTGRSRAEVLFDRTALGFLGNNSLIRLGEDCFRLDRGQVLINGPQTACLGTKVLGIRGTTYVITTTPTNQYKISVLAGEVVVSDQQIPENEADQKDILSLYPRLNPLIGFGLSGWVSNEGGQTIGEASGLFLDDVSFFLPFNQIESRRLTYSYSTLSTNLGGFWNTSTELGYTWFDPNNRSISSLMVGYDGWDSQTCFHSQLAVGGQWEKGRWQFGINGGFPVDSCEESVGYYSARIGIPVVNHDEQSTILSLSPYVLDGNNKTYAGGRLTVEVPIGEQLSASIYGQYDDLTNTTIGGKILYRFAPAGSFINDPNKDLTETSSHIARKLEAKNFPENQYA